MAAFKLNPEWCIEGTVLLIFISFLWRVQSFPFRVEVVKEIRSNRNNRVERATETAEEWLLPAPFFGSVNHQRPLSCETAKHGASEMEQYGATCINTLYQFNSCGKSDPRHHTIHGVSLSFKKFRLRNK